MTSPIPSEWATKIYELLQKYGANPNDKSIFVIGQSREVIREWRFSGVFGFGGKFWNYDSQWYVNYYPEDFTPERDKAQEELNSALSALRSEYLSSQSENTRASEN